MLRETPRSLRLYFGIVAALSLLWGVRAIYLAGSSPLVVALSGANIVFGFLFAYITIRFTELLPRRPAFIRNVLAANLALAVIGFLLSLSGGIQPGALFSLGIALLIYFYLVKSVTRLSAEATSKNA
jgi:hypothetical protein